MSTSVCIIQGNIRKGTDLILNEMSRHFDKVILSTWENEISNLPKGKYEVVISDKPANSGFTNRNLQRLSCANGIRASKAFNPDFILKWRTDLLPTNFNLPFLIKCATWNVPKHINSRIVLPSFRNLPYCNDWFSCLQDLYAFGGLEEIELLWGDVNFDYSLPFNLPNRMIEELKLDSLSINALEKNIGLSAIGTYDAHSELYAIFKSRLIEHLGYNLSCSEIISDFLYLIDTFNLKVCWFNNTSSLTGFNQISFRKFRSFKQSYNIKWLSEKDWKQNKISIAQADNNSASYIFSLRKYFFLFFLFYDRQQQAFWFKNYQKANKNTL